MQNSITVVICCAGMGRRLQISKTKALVPLMGRPLIGWQLEALKDQSDIRIVVGYQAQDVIDYVKSIRMDVLFVFNREYENSGTAASLVKASEGARDFILSLDGDLLITPPSLKSFLSYGHSALGYVPFSTEEPTSASLNKVTQKIDFFGTAVNNETHQPVEWSGLCCLSSHQLHQSVALGLDKNHVYQLVEPHLPLPAFPIDAQEIDTPSDLKAAENFIANKYHLWEAIK